MTAAELSELVARGLEMVEARLQRSPGFGLYLSVRNQLKHIQGMLAAGERSDDALLDRLTLGIYAAREFESSDPEFANVLFEVEYWFKRVCLGKPP